MAFAHRSPNPQSQISNLQFRRSSLIAPSGTPLPSGEGPGVRALRQPLCGLFAPSVRCLLPPPVRQSSTCNLKSKIRPSAPPRLPHRSIRHPSPLGRGARGEGLEATARDRPPSMPPRPSILNPHSPSPAFPHRSIIPRLALARGPLSCAAPPQGLNRAWLGLSRSSSAPVRLNPTRAREH